MILTRSETRKWKQRAERNKTKGPLNWKRNFKIVKINNKEEKKGGEMVVVRKWWWRENIVIVSLRGPRGWSSRFWVYFVLYVKRCSIPNLYKSEILVEGPSIDHQNINEIKEGGRMGMRNLTEWTSMVYHLVLGACWSCFRRY